MTKPLSGRPHNLTEREGRVLQHVASKNPLSSVAHLTTKFQTASGSNVSTRTVHRELHEIGFLGRAAETSLRSPCTMLCWLEWCKALRHWTLRQWKHLLWSDKSRFTLWQSDGRIWVWRIPGGLYLPHA
jgi:hypothetical protein